MSRTTFIVVMYIVDQRVLDIEYMGYTNLYHFSMVHGNTSLWISLLIFHLPKVLMPFLLLWMSSLRWHFLPCTKTINSQEITILVMRAMFGYHCPPDEFINDRVHNSSLKFGNTCWNTCWGSSELMVSFSWAIICQDREREIDNWMESIIYIALMIDYKE